MRRWMLWLVAVSGCLSAVAVCHGQQPAKAAVRLSVPALRLMPAARVEDSLLRYVPEDVVMIGAIQPSRMLTAETFQTMVKSAKAEDLLQGLQEFGRQRMGLDPSRITEAALLIDRQSMQDLLQQRQELSAKLLIGNNLRTIAIAMHNFHDVFGTFPDDDGLDESKGNLSWRVHLLPFLEQQQLYEEFRLNEPWDSEHNKSLISRMPDVFKVDGVEPGQTSLHVFLGAGTPFGGDEPPTLRTITDGTSNTIMAVSAGADAAEVWTKPGGLNIDSEALLKALGKNSEAVSVCLFDGSLKYVRPDAEPEVWQELVRHQDQNAPLEAFISNEVTGPTPALIVRTAEPMDQERLMKILLGERKGEVIEIAGQSATRIDSSACVVFPTPQTMLISSDSLLEQMLAPRQPSQGLRSQLEQSFPESEVVLIGNFEDVKQSLMAMLSETPFSGAVASITQASLVLNFTGSRPSLLEIKVTTDNPESAQMANGIVTGGFQFMKAQVLNELSQPEIQVPEKIVTIVSDVLDSVRLTNEDRVVTLEVPRLENSSQLVAGLSTELTALAELWRQAAAAQRDITKVNSIKQMGLAMHIFHDTYSHFPTWDGLNKDQIPGGDQPKGLSWRVHILPFINEAELYSEFHLDEPWDSEHNKTLIEKMPDVFRTEDVEDPGKTCYHVFLGEKTPLGGKGPRSIRDIIDGTSNTLMIVEAGPDKADVWTRPTGLTYVPEDPLKSLGDVGERFLVCLCDGSSRFIESTISKVNLRRLIEHADGEIVDEF